VCSVDSVDAEVAAELKQLMDEVWLLGSLSHPSITRFCAVVLDPPMIVMQVCVCVCVCVCVSVRVCVCVVCVLRAAGCGLRAGA
jgi:hypothetical protein